MFPMLEMCAPKSDSDSNHSKYISDVLYRYRMDNVLSEFRVDFEETKRLNRYFRDKPSYEPLDDL